MSEHSKFPWRHGYPDDAVIYDAKGDDIGFTFAGGNSDHEAELAAFIVRACNAHEALIAALDEARQHLVIEGYAKAEGTEYGVMLKIDAALALARGEQVRL